MDQIKPMWTEQNQSGQNGPNRIRVDQIGPKQTEWTEQD